MAQVFISYAREDRDSAVALADMLHEAGISVWWDREIEFGEPFADVIERELGEATCAVVLWSKHSVTSNWVRAEAGDAAERSKLFPALLDDSRPPLQFRGLHTADLSSWRGRAGDPSIEDFVAHLRAQVGAGPKPAPAPKPAAHHRGLSPRTLALVIASICLALVGGGLALFFGLSQPGEEPAEAETPAPATTDTGSSGPAQPAETGGEESGPGAGESSADESGEGPNTTATTDTGEAETSEDEASESDTDTGDPEPVKAKPAVKRPRVSVELTASDYFYVEVRIGRGRAIPLEPKAKIRLPAGRHTLYMRESASAKWRRVKQIELEAGKRYRVDLLRPLGAKVSEQ